MVGGEQFLYEKSKKQGAIKSNQMQNQAMVRRVYAQKKKRQEKVTYLKSTCHFKFHKWNYEYPRKV